MARERIVPPRQVHVNNPEAALRKAWDRLMECYAAPEVIENGLFKKLDMFPKISSKDYIKLRELGELLMEFQSAKEDGYLPALAFLDTARGIGPICTTGEMDFQRLPVQGGTSLPLSPVLLLC